ncbi:MAG: PorT family protein [Muribaculaceae bacterium]|nr:PorT family protein [Muribaculaceae bacterium]
MRKIIILAVMALASLSAAAQFRYAAIAGADFTTLKFKQDLVEVNTVVGYSAGVQGELMFPGIGLGIDLGVLYNQVGAKVNLGQKPIWSTLGYGDERVYIHNLNIPVHLRFKWTRMNGLEEKIAPFVFGGPEFNLQLGHSRCEAIKFSGGDMGLTAGIGAELYRRWQVSGSYTWGMTYALKTRLLDDFSARNRAWTVRVAYFF